MQNAQAMDMKESPFASILAGGLKGPSPMQGGAAPAPGMGAGPMPGAGMPAGMPQAPGAPVADAMKQEPNELVRGENPDNLKPLVGATQQLERFITESTNKKAIMMARGLIGALARLMSMTQTPDNEGPEDQSAEGNMSAPAPLM
jgi:hypothetical protein